MSLVFQARELRMARAQALRMLHFDLLKMAMDDPLYSRAWGPSRFADDDERRQNMYVNLIISYWQMAYEMGDANEAAIRTVAADFFAGEVGEGFWREWSGMRRRVATNKSARRFHEILDEEYEKATGPPASPEPAPPGPAAPAAPGDDDASSGLSPDQENTPPGSI